MIWQSSRQRLKYTRSSGLHQIHKDNLFDMKDLLSDDGDDMEIVERSRWPPESGGLGRNFCLGCQNSWHAVTRQ